MWCYNTEMTVIFYTTAQTWLSSLDAAGRAAVLTAFALPVMYSFFFLLLLSLIIVPEHTCLQQETYHHTNCAALLLTACIPFQNNHSQSLSSVLPQFRLYMGEREGRPKRSQSSQRFTFYRSSSTAKKKIKSPKNHLKTIQRGSVLLFSHAPSALRNRFTQGPISVF